MGEGNQRRLLAAQYFFGMCQIEQPTLATGRASQIGLCTSFRFLRMLQALGQLLLETLQRPESMNR